MEHDILIKLPGIPHGFLEREYFHFAFQNDIFFPIFNLKKNVLL